MRLGVRNLVVQPVCLDEQHKGVNHDKSDAKQLALRLDRYVAGNAHALATVRVPTPAEEQKRIESRQREQLKREVKRVAAQGRSLLLTQGQREKKGWWEEGRWAKLKAQLPTWLAGRLECFRRVLATLTAELDAATAALEQAAPTVRPKGLGGLSYEVVEPEVGDWRRFTNRRHVGSADVVARCEPSQGRVNLDFHNLGRAGAVFHVYDHRRLELIPRRYTVEAGKSLADAWTAEGGAYHLWVYGPNGFVREFKGALAAQGQAQPEIAVAYDPRKRAIALTLSNTGAAPCVLSVRHNAYRTDPAQDITLAPRRSSRHRIALVDSFDWYDLTVSGDGFERRLAGRLETGAHGVSDPASAV